MLCTSVSAVSKSKNWAGWSAAAVLKQRKHFVHGQCSELPGLWNQRPTMLLDVSPGS